MPFHGIRPEHQAPLDQLPQDLTRFYWLGAKEPTPVREASLEFELDDPHVQALRRNPTNCPSIKSEPATTRDSSSAFPAPNASTRYVPSGPVSERKNSTLDWALANVAVSPATVGNGSPPAVLPVSTATPELLVKPNRNGALSICGRPPRGNWPKVTPVNWLPMRVPSVKPSNVMGAPVSALVLPLKQHAPCDQTELFVLWRLCGVPLWSKRES